MKVLFLGLMMVFAVTARGQFLGGIFAQGATELREYGQQIAALALLIDRSEKGYQLVETGLADIGGVTGTEYGLHQTYFGSLAAVNPSVAQMPEVEEILTMEAEMVSAMASAMNRWRASGRLTTGEMSVVAEVYSGVAQAGEKVITELKAVLADSVLVMEDGQRMGKVAELVTKMKEFGGGLAEYMAGVDLLVSRRTAGLGPAAFK